MTATVVEIKTQGIYDALYNFRTDTVGGNPTDWSTFEAQGTIQIIDNKAVHKRVIELHDTINSGATNPLLCSNDFSASQGNGTIEFYIMTDDVTQYTLIRVQTVCFDLIIDGSKWQYNAAGNIPAFDGVIDPVNDTWYHVLIYFRADGAAYQGLNNYEWKVTIDSDTTSAALAFANNNVPATLLFASGQTDSDYYSWFDAVDYSWASGYSENRNLLLEAHTDITSETLTVKLITELAKFPKAQLLIMENIFDDDTIIIMKKEHTSWQKGKGMYKGTYNFRDDTIGEDPVGWVVTEPANTSVNVIDKYNKHRKVIEFADYSAAASPNIYQSFTETVTGTVEYYKAITDITDSFMCIIGDGGWTSGLVFMIRASKFQYYDNAYHDITDVNAGQWYHIKIVFDCASTWSVWIDDTEYGPYAYRTDGGAPTAMDQILFSPESNAVTDFLAFLDAVSYSWDTDYILGDNKILEVTLSDQVIFEGRIKKESNEYKQKINLIDQIEELKMPVGEEDDPVTIGNDFTPNMISDLLSNYNHAIATEQDEIYRATYNFLNDSNASTPFGVLDDSEGTGTMEVLTASLGSHKNYIHITHDGVNHGIFKMVFEAQTSGVIEWYVRTSNVATGMTEMFFYDSDGVVKIKLTIQGSKHKWYDGVGLIGGSAAGVNTWYHYRMSFDCATDTFSLWVDGNLEADGADFFAVSADIGQLRCEANHDIGDPTFDSYLDAFGFSWDWRYPECITYVAASDPTDTETYENKQILVDYIEPSAYGIAVEDVLCEGDVDGIKFLKDHIDKELSLLSFLPTKEIVINDGSNDSQIDFSTSDPIWGVRGVKTRERVNKIVVKGGITAGHRVYATANNTDSQTTYGVIVAFIFAGEIIEEAILQNIADNALAEFENAPFQIKLGRYMGTEGLIQVGETVTIAADDLLYQKNNTYVASGEWIITKIMYYPLKDIAQITLVNSIMFKFDKKVGVQMVEKLINTTL